MKQDRVLIERRLRDISNMTAFLKVKCMIANKALRDIRNEVLPDLNVTNSIARDIAEGKTEPILEAMRGTLEKEATDGIATKGEPQISQRLKIIEEKIRAIYSKSERNATNEDLWFKYNFYFHNAPRDWNKYIILNGDEISFDEKAVENDSSTFIIPGSAEHDYLQRAELLCKQISEFILLTQQLGYSKAVSSDDDSVIYISKRDLVQLDTKKIARLDFSGYEAALEAAQQKSHFERESVEH